MENNQVTPSEEQIVETETQSEQEVEATGIPEQENDVDPETSDEVAEKIKQLEAQINSMHRRLNAQAKRRQKVPAPKAEKKTEEPKIADFETIEAFETAKSEYDIDQKIKDEISKVTKQQQDQSIEQERSDFAELTLNEGRSKFNDWKDVVETNRTLPITLEMLDIVREMDNPNVIPADIFYYLGKNPAETAAISNMSKTAAVRALTRIEAKLETVKSKSKVEPQKTEKKISNAPPPIKPSDSAVIISKDPNKMTQREFEQWRKKGGGV